MIKVGGTEARRIYMEIYGIYQVVLIFGVMLGGTVSGRLLYGSLSMAAGIWLILFVLQGIGLCTMGKKRGVKNRWLAFVPFANVCYMGKLAGTCSLFGRKMKRPGLYVLISQILAALACGATIAAEIFLFTKCTGEMVPSDSGTPQWPGLTGFPMYVRNYYYYSDFIISIVQLAYTILLFILMTGLYKKYTARNYFLLSWLALFLPVSKYIVVFVIRNNKAIDYDAYMRARREAFMRRQQQNPYGRPPYGGYGGYGNYGGNPYNSPPYNQGPYNQGPYAQNPNGGQAGGSGGTDDPFSEFASGSASKNSSDGQRKQDDPFSSDGSNGAPNGGSGGDDLFG